MTESWKTGNSSTVDDLERLRDLILGEKINRLHKLDRRVSDPESRTEDVAEVLPDAMNRVVEDPVAKPKIEQPIVNTIRGAIKRDTESFAEALFPVLGPAIRRAVADALKSLVQRINVALEHSFSAKGLRWRMEAVRSGLPFGQIVLRETMLYAVQEVFLIQRYSGLVLESVRRDEALALDEDAFSAMLTAIQAFIQDSLGMAAHEQLRSAELGDRTLWVINGPSAALACVISGAPPHEVRDQLMDALETLHARYGDQFGLPPEQLADHSGINTLLQETLREEPVEAAHGPVSSKYKILWGGVGLALLLLLAWSAWSTYRVNRLEQEVARLFEDEPGYLLTEHDAEGGQLYLAGLRDPLAESPESVLQGVDADVEGVTLAFRPYQSLDQEIVLRRLRANLGDDSALTLEIRESNLTVQGELTSAQYAMLEGLAGTHPVIHSVNLAQTRIAGPEAADLLRRQLDAPPSVTITPSDDRMVLSGTATAEWFGSAASGAAPIGGWPLDFTPLRTTLSGQLDALESRVSGRSIMFERQIEISSAVQGELDTLGRELVELQNLAAVLQADLTIRLEGFADGVGSPEKNRELALGRARTVQSELGDRGVDTSRVSLAAGHWTRGDSDLTQRRVLVQVDRESAN